MEALLGDCSDTLGKSFFELFTPSGVDISVQKSDILAIRPVLSTTEGAVALKLNEGCAWSVPTRTVTDSIPRGCCTTCYPTQKCSSVVQILNIGHAHVKYEHAGPKGRHGDEGDIGGHLWKLALYPPPSLGPKKTTVDGHDKALCVYESHLHAATGVRGIVPLMSLCRDESHAGWSHVQ